MEEAPHADHGDTKRLLDEIRIGEVKTLGIPRHSIQHPIQNGGEKTRATAMIPG